MFKKIIKFGIVGGLGTVTNLVIFFLLADKLCWIPTLASIICFFIAGTQNYILNHIWTFKIVNEEVSLSIKLWFKFLISSLSGLGVNLLVMNLLIQFYNWQHKVIPQGVGIAFGMVINFILSNFVVFRRGKENES